MPNNIIRQDYGTVGTDVQTQMLIAPVLAEMKADRQFAVSDQFIVDSVLYKITTAISVIGTPLVVDSNCEVSDTISQQIGNKRIVYSEFEYTIPSGGTSSDSLVIGGYRCALNLSGNDPNYSSDNLVAVIPINAYSGSGTGRIFPFGCYNKNRLILLAPRNVDGETFHFTVAYVYG